MEKKRKWEGKKSKWEGSGEEMEGGIRDNQKFGAPAAVAFCCMICSQNASVAALISEFEP